jgi:hypothetical protein
VLGSLKVSLLHGSQGFHYWEYDQSSNPIAHPDHNPFYPDVLGYGEQRGQYFYFYNERSDGREDNWCGCLLHFDIGNVLRNMQFWLFTSREPFWCTVTQVNLVDEPPKDVLHRFQLKARSLGVPVA